MSSDYNSEPLVLVNPLQGTDSRREFSTGNTYPAVGVPRGMTYWTPQTSDGRFIFDRADGHFRGVRATHSPSPWMGDFGHFDITPIVGVLDPDPERRTPSIDLARSAFSPHESTIIVNDINVKTRLTATHSCGLLTFDYPPTGDSYLVIQTGKGETLTFGEVQLVLKDNVCEVIGVSRSNHGGCREGFGCYFVVRINGEVEEVGTLVDSSVAAANLCTEGPRAGAYLKLASGQRVKVEVGTSYIGIDQARSNLAHEVAGRSFAEVSVATGDLWNRWLKRIVVQNSTDDENRCLATAMYRVGLFPMAMHEPTHNGALIYRSPLDGRIHSGVFFTNNGFWDTHRTVYPLLGLIDPNGFGEIVAGFLQFASQTGWLPKWASPGFRDCMVGTHIDAVISEAVAQNIPGFDVEEAYEAIRKNAFEQSDSPEFRGRMGLKDYDRFGFVPHEVAPYSVSRTLDFSYLDWCVAQVALRIGRHTDAQYLLNRSKNYRNLWHGKACLMRPKNSNGDWVLPWEATSWGSAYIEGSAWQHSFHVPHDPAGLAELHGCTRELIFALDKMLDLKPSYSVGAYGHVIHEMAEMEAAVDRNGKSFGQYAHSNEPVHGYLWYPAALGYSDWTARQVRRVLEGLYGPDFLPGDEDNGEMSAWYILAMMGRFPICPGSGEMLSVSCAEARVEVRNRDSRGTRIDPKGRAIRIVGTTEVVTVRQR